MVTNTPYENIFTSHAHGDHIAGFSARRSTKYSLLSTKEIFEARFERKVTEHKSMEYEEKVRIGDVEVVAHNAGHMLGSTQFEIKTNEGIIVYTGDINCNDTLTTKAAKPITCDILITEATYGRPDLIFPPREETYLKILKWVIEKMEEGTVPAFNVYSAGKAQELIRLINQFTRIRVVSHPKIIKICEIYGRHGIELDVTSQYPKEQQDKFVEIKQRNSTSTNNTSARATGWAVKFTERKGVFPLSSHADFYQLLNYVNKSRPQQVFTYCGYAPTFAYYIKKRLAINASPLREMK
ncbi:MAG: MBL fold metallo-hydrolase [Candidatus Bathyarchaeota archaeon]